MSQASRAKRIVLKGVVGILIVFLMGTGAQAAEERKSTLGRTITFVVPVSPGGGADTASRMLAPFLKKYLPGQPNVVVKNVPGGEWRVGIMEMYKAKPDGSTICMIITPGTVIGQITGVAEYDLTKINWIGMVHDTPDYLTFLSAKSKFRTLDDLRKADSVKVGVTGFTSATTVGVIISAHDMGYKVKLINHSGSSEIPLSAIRGDIDMATYAYSFLKRFLMEGKDLIPFAVYAKERMKQLPNTPTIGELGYEGLLDVVAADYMIGTAPGTSPTILNIFREAFDKAVADAEYKAMKEKYLEYKPLVLNGEQTTQRVKRYFSVYSKYKDLFAERVAK